MNNADSPRPLVKYASYFVLAAILLVAVRALQERDIGGILYAFRSGFVEGSFRTALGYLIILAGVLFACEILPSWMRRRRGRDDKPR